ncbi:SMR domain-containing protein At5g58720 [Phalaenopsis equestris]|uniref:SMR domain-containing protein At5g58720 n=1 Tax=Phalaenopsis equestris TaxID=78828 RepID=UPI0009E5DC81|nr:SMR domain-containing protein At5g58720 [Phalaenopsis equestris]
MKPSKRRKNKSKVKTDLSRTQPNSPASVITDAGGIEETKDDRKIGLDWLISAFPRLSVEQIESAYEEVGGDTYKAAGILGAELVDPGECPGSGGKKRSARKPKRIAASTGMISGVIGKHYSKSASACSAGRRGLGGPVEGKKPAVCTYSSEEAEELLYSMLGGDSELGMGVVRDVLSQCGYDLKKLTDKPPVSTYHPFAIEQDILQFVGSDGREHLKVPLNTKEQVPLRSGMVDCDLQQKILDYLFNVPEISCVVNSLRWKVVKQVESFSPGLEFSFEGAAEPSSESRVDKEGDYHVLRSASEKNWNTMKSYYRNAALAYSRGERAQASYLSEQGKFYKKLAHEADEKASREIFEARNKGIKNSVTIDLHGQHVNQAIRLLKLHLLLFAYIPSVHFLRVITGCGANGVGLGKLRRAVLDLAQKEDIKFNQENSGTILLCLEGQRTFSFMESEVDSDENKP